MSKKLIKIGVIGATGYVGLDLVLLLSKHPHVKIKYLCAQKNIGKKIQFFDKRIKKKLPAISNISTIDYNDLHLIFLSLPNREAQKIIKAKYKKYPKLKFIDLSADFRLSNPKDYKKFYKKNHLAKNLIKKSIYSVSELEKNNLKKFRIISNPGCYPTSIQIPLIPLLKKNLIKRYNITIDSKSGYSGAGKNYLNKFRHKNFYQSAYAYAVTNHRHTSEIDQQFERLIKSKVQYTFNPHLIPTFRGMLSTIYVETNRNVTLKKILREIKSFYKDDIFIKIKKANEEIGSGNVINTNNCEISVCQSKIKNKLIIFSAIDNLIKGASGQAVQNMNILFKFKETSGLV